jgi:predicted dinucleotide-binding enzyme
VVSLAGGDRISAPFAYEWRDANGGWFRYYGNENWEFDAGGLMQRRFASINDLPITEADRKFHWPLGHRPDDHPGLIGAGKIGACIARKFKDAGAYRADRELPRPRDPRRLGEGGRATAVSVVDIAKQSDVLVISVPMKAIQQFSANLLDGARHDLIVVDTGNYFSFRDGRIEALEKGVPETKWVAERLGRPVVKAFNSISIDSLRKQGRPKGSPERIALPVAGDKDDCILRSALQSM